MNNLALTTASVLLLTASIVPASATPWDDDAQSNLAAAAHASACSLQCKKKVAMKQAPATDNKKEIAATKSSYSSLDYQTDEFIIN